MEKLKSRINKLLMLSRDAGATESEAQAAMEKAMQLMASYQLSMADLENTQADQDVTRSWFYDNSRDAWRRLIWGAVADLYMCSHYYVTGGYDEQGRRWNTKHALIGEPANIEIAKSMALHFVDIGEALALQHAGKGRSFIDSFKKGYASRMSSRLRARKQEAKTQTVHASTGAALVLADQYQKAERKIAIYKQSQGVKTKGVRIGVSNGSGYSAGRSAADGVAVGGAISSSAQVRLIG